MQLLIGTFNQGATTYAQTYQIDIVDTDTVEAAVRDMAGPSVGAAYVLDTVKDILSRGESELGWVTWARELIGPESTCQHCGRRIVLDSGMGWCDPEAGFDDEFGDGTWRETCDAHDTLDARHEPLTE